MQNCSFTGSCHGTFKVFRPIQFCILNILNDTPIQSPCFKGSYCRYSLKTLEVLCDWAGSCVSVWMRTRQQPSKPVATKPGRTQREIPSKARPVPSTCETPFDSLQDTPCSLGSQKPTRLCSNRTQHGTSSVKTTGMYDLFSNKSRKQSLECVTKGLTSLWDVDLTRRLSWICLSNIQRPTPSETKSPRFQKFLTLCSDWREWLQAIAKIILCKRCFLADSPNSMLTRFDSVWITAQYHIAYWPPWLILKWNVSWLWVPSYVHPCDVPGTHMTSQVWIVLAPFLGASPTQLEWQSNLDHSNFSESLPLLSLDIPISH
jgi:hypothetical protein